MKRESSQMSTYTVADILVAFLLIQIDIMLPFWLDHSLVTFVIGIATTSFLFSLWRKSHLREHWTNKK